MTIYGMTDRAILAELGRRLKRRRLDRNLSQQQVADRAGLNRTTVGELERGASGTLQTFVATLRALEALDELEDFLPDPGLSPLDLAKRQGRLRRRATGRRGRGSKGGV